MRTIHVFIILYQKYKDVPEHAVAIIAVKIDVQSHLLEFHGMILCVQDLKTLVLLRVPYKSHSLQ